MLVAECGDKCISEPAERATVAEELDALGRRLDALRRALRRALNHTCRPSHSSMKNLTSLSMMSCS